MINVGERKQERMSDLVMKGGTIKRKPPLEIIKELELKHKIKIEIKDNLYHVFRDDSLLFIAHTLSALERNMKIKERIK